MIDRLIEILGEKNVTDSPQELENYSVTGKIPALLLFPASSDQIAKIMKLAKREGKKVLIAGNNSQCYFGATSEAFDWCVSLNRMNNIIEYESADLTVTVESGVTLRQLQKFLNKHNNFYRWIQSPISERWEESFQRITQDRLGCCMEPVVIWCWA